MNEHIFRVIEDLIDSAQEYRCDYGTPSRVHIKYVDWSDFKERIAPFLEEYKNKRGKDQ